MFDVTAVRRDFPILSRTVSHGKPLVYLDSAATSQKPLQVITAIDTYYRTYNANIHRGIHTLSEEATAAYEGARVLVRDFIHARSEREIIFVRNATEAINLVAQSWGRANFSSGDEIILTVAEHHSNIVPWQMVAEERGAKIVVWDMNDEGYFSISDLEKLITPKTKFVSVTQVSNVLGTILPVKEIVDFAHRHGVTVLVDGAQGVPHLPVNVQSLGCDFYVFSGHKMLGPTGIGVLYGKESLLDAMNPYQGGGDMIREVRFEKTLYADLPQKFEAGTPHIAGAIGLGAGISYLTALGMDSVRRHEISITEYALEKLKNFPGITVFGPSRANDRGGVIAFNMNGVHAHDMSTILNEEGVAIRAGHHCAQPLMRRLGQIATARVSFYVYTNKEDVDVFLSALLTVKKVFGV